MGASNVIATLCSLYGLYGGKWANLKPSCKNLVVFGREQCHMSPGVCYKFSPHLSLTKKYSVFCFRNPRARRVREGSEKRARRERETAWKSLVSCLAVQVVGAKRRRHTSSRCYIGPGRQIPHLSKLSNALRGMGRRETILPLTESLLFGCFTYQNCHERCPIPGPRHPERLVHTRTMDSLLSHAPLNSR